MAHQPSSDRAIAPFNQLALGYAIQSTEHTNRVFILIQLSCAVILLVFWQGRQLSWPALRLKSAQAAVMVAECNAKAPALASGCLASLNPYDRISGETFLKQSGFSQEEARNWLSLLQSSMINHVINPGIPLLGTTISVDVNDLIIWGAVGLSTLLVWLRFALWREFSNIRLLFMRCAADGSDELRNSYELLAMTQVLTVPRALKEYDRQVTDDRPLAWVYSVMLVSPALIQALQLAHYWLTSGAIREPTQVFVARTGFAEGLLMFVVLTWLSWECLRLRSSIQREWDIAYRIISEHHRRNRVPRNG
jgi:hypothetical protein